LKLEELRQGVDQAFTRAQEVKEQRQPDSVPAVAEEWLARHVRPNARSWREIERIINREVLPALKHKLITQVGKPDILRLLDSIVDRGSPVMANRTRAYLKSWLGWAEERGYISASPMGSIKRATVEKSRERVLSDEEMAIVWTSTVKLGYPFGPFVQSLMLSAQRRGEVAGMRWEDVNLERGIWTLPAWASSEQTNAVDLARTPTVRGSVSVHNYQRKEGNQWFFKNEKAAGPYQHQARPGTRCLVSARPETKRRDLDGRRRRTSTGSQCVAESQSRQGARHHGGLQPIQVRRRAKSSAGEVGATSGRARRI
jgi:integrase